MASPAEVTFNYKGGSELPAQVKELFQALDVEGKGYLSQQELQDLVAAKQRGGGRGTRNGQSEYSLVTSTMVQDLGISGKRPTQADMTKIHTNVTHLQGERRLHQRLIAGMLIALVALAAATFGVCFAAVELAKEMHAEGDRITVSSGETALVGSVDTEVVGGMIVGRNDHNQGVCNNATGGCSRHALATRPAAEPHQLSSRIANEVFKSLDSITFSFNGEGSTTMTFKIHGFVRARSARSEYGTVVHLELLKGTLTLDGSNIYLDGSLSSYLESLGLMAADQRVQTHGRRLQDGQAVVTGFFSIFDEWEFEDLPDGVEKPRAPTLPYRATLLERRPCPSVEACKSQFFEGEFLPGYDAATNSIDSRVEIVETEAWSMSITRVPNHPTQQLLTFSDHVAQTTRLIQFAAEDFPTRCSTDNYTAAGHFNASDWYMTYVGDVERQETVYELLDEVYTVGSSTNRFFHLISKNVSHDTPDEDAIIHFEDDSATLMMKRTFIPNAAAEGWELEEVIVLALEEINDTRADALFDQYADLFDCGINETDEEALNFRTDFPVVDLNVFSESLDDVLFYAQDFIDVDKLGVGAYWLKAVSSVAFLQQTIADEEEALVQSATLTNATNVSAAEGDRRLFGITFISWLMYQQCILMPVLKKGDESIEFCRWKSWAADQKDCEGCSCDGFSVSGGPAYNTDSGTGWYGSGSLGIGDFCVSPYKFAVLGMVEAGHTTGYEKKFKGIGFKCFVSLYGRATARYGKYGYKCAAGIKDCSDHKNNEYQKWEEWCNSEGYTIKNSHRRLDEDLEDGGEDLQHYDDGSEQQQPKLRGRSDRATNATVAATYSEDSGDEENEDLPVEAEEESEDDEEEEATERRLGDGRRRRRGLYEDPHRRRRTKWCSREKWHNQWNDSRRRFLYKNGADVAFRVGAIGECKTDVGGVGIKGHFEMYFGPFPKNPLVPKWQGKIGISACVILPLQKICLSIFDATLWSKQI